MKKSLIYKCAQVAVMNHVSFTDVNKLEILRELIAQEDLALFIEKQEEEEAKAVKLNETV